MSYNIFANYRNVGYRYTSDSNSTTINRFYLGGNIGFSNKNIKIQGDLKIKSSGDYSLKGILNLGLLNVSYYSSLHEPSIFLTSIVYE